MKTLDPRPLALGVLALLAGCGGCGRSRDPKEGGAASASVAASAASASTAPAGPGVKAALGGKGGEVPFKPGAQGFKFGNYGNDEGYENMSASEVKRLFGASVCAIEENGVCTLTPPAARWLESTNKAMGGGHCEGIAALALLFQVGKASTKDFGADTTFGLEINGNTKLQREIALWFSTQAIEPMASAEIRDLSPSQVADRLVEAFKSGSESYTLGIYQPDGSSGHATTAYAVVDKGDDITWILHYDNNYPGEEKHIEVNRKDNTWTYFTASNPSAPGMDYKGDAGTHSLAIAPTNVRIGKLICPFCGDVDGPDEAATQAKGSRQVVLDGEADLQIADENGKRVGIFDGKIVDEIPGASVIPLKSGGPRASHHEPLYELPGSGKLVVTLDGSRLKTAQPSDVALFGPGYVMNVVGVILDPGQKDTIAFSSDWTQISYTTQQNETPGIAIGVEETGADWAFLIKTGGESEGQTVELGLDIKLGQLSVEASAADGTAAYAVEIHRFDGGGEQIFAHQGLSEGAKDRLVFHYGEWKGNDQPMPVGVDKSNDGTIDQTESVSDEN